MFKFLLLVLLVLSSIFAVPTAYSSHDVCGPGFIETVEPETGYTTCVFDDKVVEEMASVVEFEFADFQEHIQMQINPTQGTTEISAVMLSPSSQDILIPPKLEKSIFNEERIHAVVFTNKWQCVPGAAADPCVMVQITREGLGEFTETIQKNTREITDKIVTDSQFIGMKTKFHSILIEADKPSEGIPPLATAVYTTKVFSTSTLLSMIGDQLLDKEIRDGGGFYDILNKLTENEFAEFTLTLKPDKDRILRTMMITVSTAGLPYEMFLGNYIDPLHLINASIPSFSPDKIERSKYFSEGFYPLNSIFNVVVITNPDYRVKSVNGGLIASIATAADLQNSGWFFISNSNGKIEGRYLFGSDISASSNDLFFSITNNKSEYLGVVLETHAKVMEPKSSEPQGGCLIATAAFGSEMAPQVQLLREIRDNAVLQTELGTSFMTGFNQFYYSFSPAVADYERENPAFKEAVKITLTPLLTSLTLLQYADIDSESEMLGYGIGVILLNIGMYFVVPAVVTLKLVKKYRKINF